MRAIAVFISGLLFGLGVTISGMVNPMKVLNFMDLAGIFDPTLVFVMGAGLVVTLLGYRVILSWKKPLFDDRFHMPSLTAIDTRLVSGAALFGVGWGLSGFCPGPAVASIVFGESGSLVFVATMAVGMVVTRQALKSAS
ncbi:MAG: YeeE/YedE family protein [Phyllobacteriaceae bacterium]|nr:YeeE/YedE family protein [Phyllobacteriaceae bacterium]